MSEDQQKRTEINELGEFGLIDMINEKFNISNETTKVGIGDDAAVLSESDEMTVVSTDMLLEGVHFDLMYMPLKHLGYKSVAVNVSDIAAMNAIPHQITVNLALSNRFSVEAVNEFYEGVKAACKAYKVDLIGGDTTSSRAGLVISVTAIGRVKEENLVLRSGAKKGDILCVTGDLGGAYMGLQMLEREKQAFMANPNAQPDLAGKDYIVGRQLKPEARTDMVHELKELGVTPTSMIDISDGLASETLHLCKQSNLGAVIYEEKLPMDEETFNAASEFQIASATVLLNVGEDYELLFTIKQEDHEKFKNSPNVTMIGYMTAAEEGAKFVTKGQQVVPIEAQGWKHFE